MEKSLIEIYWEKLKEENGDPKVICDFFSSSLSQPVIPKNRSAILKLTKLYGSELVFMAVSDLYDMENLNFENIYPILAYFCKKRFSEKLGEVTNKSVNLTDRLEQVEKRLEKMNMKKIIIKELD